MLEKTLESPLDTNQSILKENRPEYSLEGLMLKLKLQYFGHLMRRANSLEKTLMLGKIESKRRWGQQRIRWLGDITDSMDMSLSQLQLIMKHREAWRAAVREVTELDTTERMNRTRANWIWGCCSDLENTFVGGDSDMCYQRSPRKRL